MTVHDDFTLPAGDRYAAMIARIDAQTRQAQQDAATAQRFASSLPTLRGRGGFAGARVEVDASGVPLAIDFDPEIERLPRAQWGQACLRACAVARADVLAQLERAAADTWGSGSSLSQQIVAEARQVLVQGEGAR